MGKFIRLLIVVTSFILLLIGCASAQAHSLTKDKVILILADYYNVSSEDIQIKDIIITNDNASVFYKVKKNGVWEPEAEGSYLAQVSKNEAGKYKVTIPKFDGNNETH